MAVLILFTSTAMHLNSVTFLPSRITSSYMTDKKSVARSSSGVYTARKHDHKYRPAPANPNLWQAIASALGFTGNQSKMPAIPMRRDTWMLAANGYTVIRFKANNPGVWFFHCHMDWHNIAGIYPPYSMARFD